MSDPKNSPDAEPATANPSPSGEVPSALARERDDLLDQLQRTRAEFVNFQKRSRTSTDDVRKYAIQPVASDLVAVMDNFERAIDAARAANVPTIVDGLDLVHRQLLATLAKHGVETLRCLGEPFDPNFHEALMQTPDAFHPEGTVVAELGKGYRIHDRVLRPAKVAVSVKPAGESSPQS